MSGIEDTAGRRVYKRTETNGTGRVPMSANAEQLEWLNEVLRRLLRGGDVSMLMRAEIAGSALKMVTLARDRARLVLLQGGAK